MKMKFEITLEVEDHEYAPTKSELREAFQQWLDHRNPYDDRNYIVNAKVVAKKAAA
jgi:hypothetical protein